MARPLSTDLRERVVVVREGASCRVVASRFGVAVSIAVKRARRTTDRFSGVWLCRSLRVSPV